ncbi:MAG: single-stranded DNA-binding protein [Planctomycetota bacterium]
MASYNKVILMGNLTRDPEVRFTQSGTALVKLGLAVNRRFQDGDGNWKDEPIFVDVTMWGKRGEAFARFHTKGKPAFVEGHLRMDNWEDRQSGQKRSKLYVVADNWEFVGPGPGGGAGAAAGAPPGGGAAYEAEDEAKVGGGSEPSYREEETPF